MRLNINPTRMELLRLKARLKVALRGHKLLKEKRDSLMKHFLEKIRKVKTLREETDKEFPRILKSLITVLALMDSQLLQETLCWPTKTASLNPSKKKNIMGVKIPQFTLESQGELICYSLAMTPANLDKTLMNLEDFLPEIVKLAQEEKALRLLGAEIEKTRRRVNALEYVLIPDIEDSIKYIDMKLIERERSVISSLMRIKELIS